MTYNTFIENNGVSDMEMPRCYHSVLGTTIIVHKFMEVVIRYYKHNYFL